MRVFVRLCEKIGSVVLHLELGLEIIHWLFSRKRAGPQGLVDDGYLSC